MNVNRTIQLRILRQVVEEFISCVKSYHSHEVPDVIDLQMLFCEIVKRKDEVAKELSNIARELYVILHTKSRDSFSDFQPLLSLEIKNIMQMLFSQDLLEIALNGDESFNITEEQLLNLLYYGALRDVRDLHAHEELFVTQPLSFWRPSLKYAPDQFSVKMNRTFDPEECDVDVQVSEDHVKNLLKSVEMIEKYRRLQGFDPPLGYDKLSFLDPPKYQDTGYCYRSRMYTKGVPHHSDHPDYEENCEIAHYVQGKIAQKIRIIAEKFQGSDSTKRNDNLYNTTVSESKKVTHNSRVHEDVNITHLSWFDDEQPNKYDFSSMYNTSEMERPIHTSNNTGFHCWEDCLGRNFLKEHIYISEASSNKSVQVISEKEYHEYSNILNTSDSVSEDNMVHDILDVLTGTPSDTFCFDIHSRKFRMKSGVHLPSMSAGCFSSLTAKFLESGSMYYALQKFSRDFLHASEGSMFKGLQLGVQEVLSIYKEYIEAVKVNFPKIQYLRKDVLENAELLLSFGVICGINPEQMIITEIPKGLGLLSYLHGLMQSHPRKEIRIMVAVLLKYVYAPYFRFLNEWMSEGVCIDPHNEFHIVEDRNYLERHDYLFWKFAYTENLDDCTRSVPSELKVFSQGILDCGKSIKLLRFLSPDLSSLKFFSSKSPPCFSMVYSYPAALCKVVECIDYLVLKENEDCIPEFKLTDISIDKLYLESQKLVDEKSMVELVKRRYDIIFAAKALKTNIVNVKMLSPDLLKDQADNPPNEFSNSSCKCECLIEPVTENKELLRETLFRNVGLLFSSSVRTCLHKDRFQILNFQLPSPRENIGDFSGKLYNNVGLLFSSCGYFESDSKSDSKVERNCKLPSPDFAKQLCISSYTHYPHQTLCKKLLSPDLETWNLFSKDEIASRNMEKKMKNVNFSSAEEALIKDMLSNITFPDSLKTKDSKNSSASNDKIKNSFMDKLTSLLVSEYGESISDIYSYIEVISLERLLVHNFQSVLKTRIHIVEKAIMKCIVREYQLDSLLFSLRNIYFLQDETFSQSLCEPLFDMVMNCKSPREFTNWAVLNDMLVNAISASDYNYNSFLFSLDMNIGFLPQDMPIERTDFLRLIIIECNVKWPLNIIVHRTCIQQYLKIFSVLLEIEFLCWFLGRTWRYLVTTSKEFHLDDSPQFRVIMLNRFDMEQFIRVIRNSIHQHLQGPLWEFLEKTLSAERSSIDDLENVHLQYLEKVLARCFLTDETDKLHQLLSTMFHHIYKICSAIHDCEWQKNAHTGFYETYTFKGLNQAFEIFKQYQNVFLKCIMKESLTKKFGRYWDRDYQEFLETILTTGKNIS